MYTNIRGKARLVNSANRSEEGTLGENGLNSKPKEKLLNTAIPILGRSNTARYINRSSYEGYNQYNQAETEAIHLPYGKWLGVLEDMNMVTVVYQIPKEYDEDTPAYVHPTEFEYEIEPTNDDYADFLFGGEDKRMAFLRYDHADHMRLGASIAIEHILETFDFIKENLDDDPEFKEFLKDRYEDEAYGSHAERD